MQVYLDHAAGGPPHPAALEAMVGWLSNGFGNPSGAHHVSRLARKAIDDARDEVAGFLGFTSGGIIFTSGGTEADNLAVLGPLADRLGAIVVSAVEHPAVLEAARASGREVRLLGVGEDGLVDLDQLSRLLDGDVALVSVQAANHETGVIQDLEAIARRVRRRSPGALFHSDAVQAAPWMDLPSVLRCVDMASVSGHKLGGPQGVGVLAVRPQVALSPVMHGGGQERRRRSGTQNVAAAIGLAAAMRARSALRADGDATGVRVAALRDRLCATLLDAVPDAVASGVGGARVPGHCHMRFPGVEAEALLFLLDEAGVCASAGAACASGAFEPSPVLMAMGVSKQEAGSCLRLTLGPDTSDEEVDFAAGVIVSCVTRLAGVGARAAGEYAAGEYAAGGSAAGGNGAATHRVAAR